MSFQNFRLTWNIEGSPQDKLLEVQYKGVRGLKRRRAPFTTLEGSSCVDNLPPGNEISKCLDQKKCIVQSCYFAFPLCQPTLASYIYRVYSRPVFEALHNFTLHLLLCCV